MGANKSITVSVVSCSCTKILADRRYIYCFLLETLSSSGFHLPNSSLKTIETLYNCFISVRSYQQCMSIEPEVRSEVETDHCESNIMAARCGMARQC